MTREAQRKHIYVFHDGECCDVTCNAADGSITVRDDLPIQISCTYTSFNKLHNHYFCTGHIAPWSRHRKSYHLHNFVAYMHYETVSRFGGTFFQPPQKEEQHQCYHMHILF